MMNPDARKVPELRYLPDRFGKSGNRERETMVTPGGARGATGISQPSDDVLYGNSWHGVDGSAATTTKPAPDVRTKKQAR
jgi:hypothetical protein